MKRFKFLLGINCQQPVGVPEQAIQKTFEQAYQPYLQAIANHPKLKFAGRFNGVLLEWLERKQPDHFELLRKLVKRGQLEMLAGGHYDPVLPLIPDDDKAGQISLANEYLKNNFGQAPRGLWLNGRTWEPSLPKILARSGIEYALVDEEHFLLAGIDPERITGYFLTEDEGELLKVFPTQGRFEEVYAGLKAVAGSEEGEAVVLVANGEDPELSGQIDQLAVLLEAPTAGVESWTFGNYLDECPAQGRTYLPTTNELETEGGYFRSQLVKYPEANYLHKKMILVSNKLRTAAQGKTIFGGVKLDQAKRELYLGQSGAAYGGQLGDGALRAAAYHHLIRAELELEKNSRGGKPFVELMLTDLDKDGEDEVLLANDLLNIYFSPRQGGAIFELDYKPRAVNLGNTLGRDEDFFQPRSSLLDHFLAPGTTLEEFCHSGFGEAGDFTQGRYSFRPTRKEGEVGLRLARTGEVQGSPVKVEKQIVLYAKQSLFLVEYELTNLGEELDEFWFGVELNLRLAPAERSAQEGISSFKLIDESKRFAVSLELGQPAVLWSFPVEYRRLYQSTAVVPNWKFRLGPKETWRVKITARIEE